MTIAIICIAIMVLMAAAPSKEALAREIAERNDRCGDVVLDTICLKPKNHKDGHDYESTSTTIPIE